MPDDFQVTLGRRVAELRKRACLTQNQLAEKVNISVESISRLERGVSVPGVETLVQIAKVTGNDPHEILLFQKNPNEKNQVIDEINFNLNQLSIDDLKLVLGLVEVVIGRQKEQKG